MWSRWPPSRHLAAVQGEGRVVVGERSQLDLLTGAHLERVQRSSVAHPERSGRIDVSRVGHTLVPRPDARVVGHAPSLAEDLHALETGRDLDPSPDRLRVHRVVVGVQADVVVPSQPQRLSPPGDRCDRGTNQTGVYEVMWTTVSVVDGHTLSGSFRFGVGVSPGAGAEGGTTDDPGSGDLLVAIGRLVEDVSLLLLLGLLLLGRLGEALVAAPSLSGGAVFAYLTTGPPGWSRSARVVLEGAGVLAASRGRRTQAPLAVAAVVVLAAAGHAAAIQPRVWGVTVEAVHLLSAGAWAGGVLALALQRPPEGWLGEAGRTLLDRFTPPALAAFAVTASTGRRAAPDSLTVVGNRRYRTSFPVGPRTAIVSFHFSNGRARERTRALAALVDGFGRPSWKG